MLAFVLREPNAETAAELIGRWAMEGAGLNAPLLAQYEIATGLARRRHHGVLSRADTDEALAIVAGLEIAFDTEPDNAQTIEIAMQMERASAYDVAYVALAERLDTKLWTFDGSLSRNAGSRDRVVLAGSG